MKFTSTLTLAVLVSFLPISNSALAEKKIVKWTDEHGVVHFGNAQPASEAKRGAQTLNAQGVVTATKTDQATALSVAEALKKQELEKAAAAKQVLEDQRMLDSYASEDDLKRNYVQNVELLDQQIIATTADIDNRQKGLNKLIATAGESERAGKPVPEPIQLMIANERAQIESQRSYIKQKEEDKKIAKTRYETELARYREVLARSKK